MRGERSGRRPSPSCPSRAARPTLRSHAARAHRWRVPGLPTGCRRSAASIASPSTRWSSMTSAMPGLVGLVAPPSRHPRGSGGLPSHSSWQATTRGVLCVDSRARWRSKNIGSPNAAVRRRRSTSPSARPATSSSSRPASRAVRDIAEHQRGVSRRAGLAGQAISPSARATASRRAALGVPGQRLRADHRPSRRLGRSSH